MLPVTAAHFAAPPSNTHQSSVLHPLHVARRAQSVSHPARFLQHLHHHRCSPAFGRSVAMHPSPAQCQRHPSTTWCQTGARQLRAGITHPVPLHAGERSACVHQQRLTSLHRGSGRYAGHLCQVPGGDSPRSTCRRRMAWTPAAAQLNPWSVMRADPMLFRGSLAQTLLCFKFMLKKAKSAPMLVSR